MDDQPQPNSIVAALPSLVPFTGPETLERQAGVPFFLRLGANESLFGASPKAIEAMQDAATRSHLYGDPEGWDLRKEIAAKHKVGMKNVILGSGIDDLLLSVSRAFLTPGDKVVTSLGGYPTFDYVVNASGGQIERVPYVSDRVDIDGLAELTARVRPKLLYLANPDNPSGSWQDAKTVRQLRDGLPSDTLLLLDEAYADFVPPHELPQIDVVDPSVLRLRTFSKAHGMAGMRVGYAVGNESQIAALNKIRLHFGVNSVALAGALASLRDPAHLAHVVEQTDLGRRVLVAGANSLGIETLPSRTNFVCLDLESRDHAEKAMSRLLKRRVFVRKPGTAPLDRCIRVTIGRLSDVETFLIELRATLAD